MGPDLTKIRIARVKDAERLAILSGQLGYPTTSKVMTKRLKDVLARRDGVCFVAENREQGVIGWIQQLRLL